MHMSFRPDVIAGHVVAHVKTMVLLKTILSKPLAIAMVIFILIVFYFKVLRLATNRISQLIAPILFGILGSVVKIVDITLRGE